MFNKLYLQLFGEAEDVAVDIINEVHEDYPHMSDSNALKVAKIAQLDRIASALENMTQELGCIHSDLNAIDDKLLEFMDCIDRNERTGSRLCITGDVTAHEW